MYGQRTTTAKTGRTRDWTDGWALCIAPKFQRRHWDQYSNVPVCTGRRFQTPTVKFRQKDITEGQNISLEPGFSPNEQLVKTG